MLAVVHRRAARNHDPMVAAVIAALCFAAAPAELAQEPAGDVVGTVALHAVDHGESLIEIARLYDLGYGEITAANPGIDPFVPQERSVVIVPTRWIVPRAATPGIIVVNLSEMRLYLARRPPAVLFTFPVGIGDEGTDTPLGTFHVIAKVAAPTWTPPDSIREEDPALPASVPPGPDNPLGTHALRLSRPTILIHGTNRPWGIGRRVSHGCIRLYPEDIPRLFEIVPVGTPVVIVREPIKVGVKDGRLYVEAHEDAELDIDYLEEAKRLLRERGLLERADLGELAAAMAERRGIPVDVGLDGS
jgi:lipoprotein-anchoring transpeptidase ErfK/SrfK